VSRKTVEGQIVLLDGAVLRDTDYMKCRLVYSGGIVPTMIGCNFISCGFEFQDEALRTLEFLHSLGMDANSGGRDFVVRTLLGFTDD